MIDISSEQVVTLSEATTHLPRRRRGKRPNIATLYRWAQSGVKGIRLETICVGATRCTSVEALQRFCEGVTAAADGKPTSPPSRLTAQRKRQIDAAEKRLAEAGI
jgi:hypothetical protein